MTKFLNIKTFLAIAAAALATALTSLAPAAAQDWLVPPPPVKTAIDPNGVDLSTGAYSTSSADVAIGDLSFGRGYYQVRDGSTLKAGWRDSTVGTLHHDSSTGVYTVTFGGRSSRFTASGGVFTPVDEKRATLVYASSIYTYTGMDGTVATFDPQYVISAAPVDSAAAVTSITSPEGSKRIYTYKCSITCGGGGQRVRLQSITSNTGFQLKFEYESSALSGASWQAKWSRLVKVTALNNGVDSCSPSADTCTFSQAWPSVTYETPSDNSDARTVTDGLGRTIRYTYDWTTSTWDGPRLTGIRAASSSSDDVTIAYHTATATAWGNNGYRVSSVTKGPLSWSYSYGAEDAGATRKVTITGPGYVDTVVRFTQPNATDWLISSETDAYDKETSYTYDTAGRVTRVTQPLGNYIENTYNAQGDVSQTIVHGGSGGGSVSETIQTLEYKAGCPSTGSCTPCDDTAHKLCHKPSKIVANGVTTWLTYDEDHAQLTKTNVGGTDFGGGVITGGIETRYTYTQTAAWYSTDIYLLTETAICASGNSCGSAAIKSTITYDTSTGGNLLPTAVTSGNSGVSATTTTAYDAFGRVSTVDGPLSGSADLVRYRYDLNGEVVGVIGADPDGGGALKHKAVRTTYDADGQVTKVEQGTVDSQSDSDWAAFSLIDYQTASYDAYHRPTKDIAYSGADAILSVVQYSYDGRGRPECTAVRMNPSVWGSPPSSACTLSTEGSNGPDRISRTTYDDDNRVLAQTLAYGTTLEHDTATYSYTDNGRVATVAHGSSSGALTAYEYDAIDRLKKTLFPSTTTSGSSGSDYEENTYDGLQLSQVRLRDGTTVDYEYDYAGRPEEAEYTKSTTSIVFAYQYDNLGRQTQVDRDGATIDTVYDGLSRKTSETGPLGAVAYEYDLAGRRTKMTYPDSFYVNYDWDLGGLTAIRENGATSGVGVLATYAYDDVGRRTGVTYGNGVTTAYGFDTASRLSSLTQNLASTGNDLTVSYTRNAVGQTLTRTMSNDIYEPTPPSSLVGTTGYTNNALNQATAAGGATLTYDGRGNLTGRTADGPANPAASYGYNLLNQLTSASGTTLEYDPAGRLAKTVGASVTTRFLYDQADMIAEYNSAGTTVQRRYVHGPGTDEPIVWYEGSGTSDRRFLVADQQGSIVAVTNSSGAATNLNSYDEYGKPGAGNVGRFQYTGQMWLPEAGLYHYKARAYSPTLGRFLQADPTGYEGGLNMYAYVGGDPVNGRDPTGMWCLFGFGTSCAPSSESDGPITSDLSEFECSGVGYYDCHDSTGASLQDVLDGYDANGVRTHMGGTVNAVFWGDTSGTTEISTKGSVKTDVPFINPEIHEALWPNYRGVGLVQLSSGFFDHSISLHGNGPRADGRSYFLPRYTSEDALFRLAARALQTGVALPSGAGRDFDIRVTLPNQVGYVRSLDIDFSNITHPSQWFRYVPTATVILQVSRPIVHLPNGPYRANSIYPGR